MVKYILSPSFFVSHTLIPPPQKSCVNRATQRNTTTPTALIEFIFRHEPGYLSFIRLHYFQRLSVAQGQHGKMNMKQPCCATLVLIYNAERETDNGSRLPREKLYHFNSGRGEKMRPGGKCQNDLRLQGRRRCFGDK